MAKAVSDSDTPVFRRLRRIEGQIVGISRMLRDGRSTQDILIQLRAAGSALKSVERHMIEGDAKTALKNALEAGDPAALQAGLETVLSLLGGSTHRKELEA